MIDEIELRKFWDIEKRGNTLTEIRLISPEGKIGSGYFKDIDTIIAEIKKYPGYGVYYTINTPIDDVFDRLQKNKILFRVKSTTQDKEIKGRDEVVIDLDPVRASGINSTDHELMYARQKANEIYKWLLDQGFHPPLCNISANGCHLKLRCGMKNTDENTEMVKKFLGVIDMLFSDDKVDCDTSLFNASRILKCCGTISYKGNGDTNSDRPRRMARYTYIPDDWYDNINSNAYFEKVAAMFPEPEQPERSNNYRPGSFDLDEFIKEHDIKIDRIVETSKMKKYLLHECPFCGSKAPDSALFKIYPSNALSFRCLHNRCQHQNFKTFRLFYDPNSYSKRDYNEYIQQQRYYGSARREPFHPVAEKEGKPKWLSLKQIAYVDVSQLASIPTGIIDFDKRTGGLLLGDVTIMSGISGAGKTSLIDTIVANVLNRGFKVAVWSGEMQGFRYAQWQHQILAGRPYVKKKEGWDNFWYCPKNIADKINEWLDGKFWLYNCEEYGSRFAQLRNDIEEVVKQQGVNLIIIDNLAALNLSDLDGQKYEKQTQFITEIKDFCKKNNTSCIIVCHPRKVVSFLRKEDVAGTADLVNLADNLVILHRVGKDFVQRAGEFLGTKEVEQYRDFSSVLEVAKNRSMGVVDYLVGLYFEPESRRLKNSIAEHIVYGWVEPPASNPLFASLPNEDAVFKSDIESSSDWLTEESDEEIPF